MGDAAEQGMLKSVPVEGAPAIERLRFRRFRGDPDFPALLDVNNGSKIADGLDHDLHTLASLKNSYRASRGFDPLRDVLVAEVAGRMVAYDRMYFERELDGTRIYTHFGFVLPEWRGKGIGNALMSWAESHAREVDATLQQEGDGPAYLSAGVYSHNPALEGLLTSRGYEPVRYEFNMETPDLEHIPDVPMPEGLEIRPVKPEHYRAIWEANGEAFQDHWGATELDESEYAGWIKHPLHQPELWVVAWDGDQVAGSILNYINRDYNARSGRKLGYTESISVRRSWRRKGLARAMLARSMMLHRELGMTQTALGVDTQNPSGALHLYESMGYEVVSRSTTYRKGLGEGQ